MFLSGNVGACVTLFPLLSLPLLLLWQLSFSSLCAPFFLFYSYIIIVLFSFLVEFTGGNKVHKTIQILRVQLNKPSSVHCTGCSLPRAKSLSIVRVFPLCPPLPTPHPFLLGNTSLLSLYISTHPLMGTDLGYYK